MRALPLILLAVAACDSMADGDYTPAYGTIEGTITADAAPEGELRVALAWLTVQPGQGAFQIAQDVEVEAPLPTRYRIDITQLPPEDATSGFIGEEGRADAEEAGLDPDMRWAQASIVAFIDGDHDQALDMTEQDGASPDHVIGMADAITIWFLSDGTPAPAPEYVGALPTEGGVSVSRAPLVDPEPGDCSGDDEQGHVVWPCSQKYADDRALLPLPATVDLHLGSDPHLDHYTCRRFWGAEEWPDWASDWYQSSPLADDLCSGPACQCSGYDCPLDLPAEGTAVTCSEDGTAYTYKVCVDDPDLCGTRFCHYGHGELAADASVPDNWPCP